MVVVVLVVVGPVGVTVVIEVMVDFDGVDRNVGVGGVRVIVVGWFGVD